MILLLSALALQLIADPAQQRDVMRSELSRSLGQGKFRTSFDAAGKMSLCKVTKTTGDADLDRTFCATQRACLAEAKPAERAFARCLDRKQEEVFDAIISNRLSSAKAHHAQN